MIRHSLPIGICCATLALTAARAQVNYEESKVPAYTLPNPLVLADGTEIRDAETWRDRRRPQIRRLFETHVHGRMPAPPAEMTFAVTAVDEHALGGRAVRKEVAVRFEGTESGRSMHLLLYAPRSEQPVPAFLGLNFFGNHTVHEDPAITLSQSWMRNNEAKGVVDHKATEESRGTSAARWPVETIIARGFALATIYYGDIDPDFDDGFANGVHPLFGDGRGAERPSNACGSIGAWAWGLSRALDYLETDPDVDAKRVAVIGHSRLGKTALWAGACDERFALVISNNSGCGGAALSRRRFGETVARINKVFPHWFCENFHAFDGREDDLPVDQHMLIALIAPRPVYVASATEDRWADPRGEFLAALHAEPVYRLLGTAGLCASEMPLPDRPVGETIGYHVRTGRHDLTAWDWERYLAFASRHFAVVERRDGRDRGPTRLRVTGRVVDPDGRPIPNAVFDTGLLHEVGLAPGTRATDASGHFDLTIAVPQLAMRTAHVGFVVRAPGRTGVRWGANIGPLNPWTGGPALELRDVGLIVLDAGRTRRGTVTGHKRAPVAGAIVRAVQTTGVDYFFPSQLAPYAITKTDADGAFVLRGVPAGPIALMVDAGGYYDRILMSVADGPIAVRLKRSGHLTGTLRGPDGEPTAGHVFVDYEGYMPGTRWECLSRRTEHDSHMPCQVDAVGADGEFRVTVRYPGLFRVRARGLHAWHEVVEGRIRAGPAAGLQLRLPGAAAKTVAIRAKDAVTGKAIENPWGASFWPRAGDSRSEHHTVALAATYETVHAVDGVLRLPGPPVGRSTTGIVQVRAPGYALRFVGEVVAERPELEVSLVPEATIAGRLEGDAVGGVPVSCQAVPTEALRRSGRAMPAMQTTTDREGRFVFRGLWADTFALRAGAFDPGADPLEIDLNESDQKAGVVLSRRAPIEVGGTLTGVREIAGCQLELGAATSPNARWFRGVATLPLPKDGSFRFPSQPAGHYRVALRIHDPMRPRWPRVHKLVTFVVGDEPAELTAAVPEKLLVRLHGTVAPAGASPPLHRFVVAALQTDGKLAVPEIARTAREYVSTARHTTAGPDGRYTLRVLPGKYRVELVDVAAGVVVHRSEEIDLKAGAEHRHDLSPVLERVQLALRGPDERPAECTVLRVKLPDVGATARTGRGAFPIQPFDGMRIWVGDRPARMTLFLPRGPVELEGLTEVSWLFGFDQRPKDLPKGIGKIELEVRRGGPHAVLFATESVSDHPVIAELLAGRGR